MHRRLRTAAAALTIVLLAAGCSLVTDDNPTVRGTTSARPGSGGAPDSSDSPTDGTGSEVSWHDCLDTATDLVGRYAAQARVSYECGTITVPKDWTAAGATPGAPVTGASMKLALMRVRADNQRSRIGSLLVNPGGPGGSGVDLAVYLSLGSSLGGLPTEILQRFDIVGFDPRGVGRSTPIKCISDADLEASFGYEPDPKSQADFDGLVELSKHMGESCAAKYGDTLPLYSTEQAARDMEAVRIAVGDRQTTYLGYSYGTLLGATYAQLFPRQIRALVLDGAIDPRQDSVSASEGQAKGFELAFTNFTEWCRATPARCPIAPDARAAVTAVMNTARTSPATGRDGRKATAGWVLYAIVSSLYSESGWERLADAIDALADGDPAKAFELADAYAERESDGTYSNMFDANAAVNCADDDNPPSVAEIRTLQEQWRAKYPLFGAPLAVGMLTCSVWPGKRDPYPTGAASGAPPIVVVGTTNDPATPYEQTAKLADMLGTGVVLTWQGEGHTAYPQTSCVTSAVDDYLIDLTVPRAGLTCPAR